MSVAKVYGLSFPFMLRPRQEEAIPLINERKNFITVLPTGYGKTPIAIMAIAKTLSVGKRAVLLSPLKVLTKEQTAELKKYFPKSRIILDDGDNRKEIDEYGDWNIAILTYERFYVILNDVNKRTIFSNLGLVVIDEVHNYGDESRGGIVECDVIMTRVLFPDCQIVGLSATIDNPVKFSDDLKMSLISAGKDERPVPLKKYVMTYRKNYNYWLDIKARVDIIRKIIVKFPDKKILIFTTSRSRTRGVISELTHNNNIKLNEALYTYKMGWHNAGMSVEEKDKVEDMFRSGRINIVAATPTLAMGVNLPADIVVMFDMYQYSYLLGRQLIEKDRLEQSMGRAGRPGFSKMGYAFVFCAESEKEEVLEHMKRPLLVESKLRNYLKKYELGWVVSEIVTDVDKFSLIENFLMDNTITRDLLVSELNWLTKHRFVHTNGDRLVPTFKGRMTSKYSIQPETVVHWERVLYKKEDLTNGELFCLIASAPEYASIVVAYDNDQTKIDYAIDFIKPRQEITRHFGYKIMDKYIDFSGNIMKIFALTYHKELIMKETTEYQDRIDELERKVEYVEKYDQYTIANEIGKLNKEINKVKKNFTFSSGDKYTVLGASERFLSISSILFRDYKQELTDLLIGAKHGIITGGIIELAKLKGIGEKRLSSLLSRNIDSVEKFISTSVSKLSEIIGLKTDSIMEIKKGAAVFL